MATDHGHDTADTTPLPATEAARIYAAAHTDVVTPAEVAAFAA